MLRTTPASPQMCVYWRNHRRHFTGGWNRGMENPRKQNRFLTRGGTPDFTLFDIAPGTERPFSRIKRIAVSDHLLLGGDNIDLAVAHRIESRLPAHEPLSEVQWNFLVARCRD